MNIIYYLHNVKIADVTILRNDIYNFNIQIQFLRNVFITKWQGVKYVSGSYDEEYERAESGVELLYCDMRDMRCDNIGSYVLVAAWYCIL